MEELDKKQITKVKRITANINKEDLKEENRKQSAAKKTLKKEDVITITGIKNTGMPHLGNIYGCMLPTIQDSKKQPQTRHLTFLADLHALISNKNPELNQQYNYDLAAAWLALGLETDKHYLFRQSKIPEVCELTWYLNCVTPYPMLANAHAFKAKKNDLASINTGLFTYPVLMAADILLYQSSYVRVGSDQVQHVEITRDIAQKFNLLHEGTFKLPKAKIEKPNMILGRDGRKMSKSYQNTLSLFTDEKTLKKEIMSIQTDTKTLAEPKDSDNSIIFQYYQLLAPKDAVDEMRKKYLAGNYGYGEAKKSLWNMILNHHKVTRKKFQDYRADVTSLEEILQNCEDKVRIIANETIQNIRNILGY